MKDKFYKKVNKLKEKKTKIFRKKIFIDGGARAGEAIELFLNNRKDLRGCDVYLFECNNAHYKTLCDIQKSNKNYNFIVRTEAIWNKNGKSDFYLSVDKWGDLGCTLDPSKNEKLDIKNPKKVKTIRFSDFISRFNNDDYLIVKLDIEGAEYNVIEDLIRTGTIGKIKEILIEWHDQFFQRDSSYLKKQLSLYNLKISNWTH